MEHRDQEMREVRRPLIHLEPAEHAVLHYILCHSRFWYAKVFREPRPDRVTSPA
jgi:hypothetical protein